MKQLTVIVENRVGAVADITRLLADEGINIGAMSVESCGTTGAAVLRSGLPFSTNVRKSL